jgi:nucleoside recognition membrane protein YjiH
MKDKILRSIEFLVYIYIRILLIFVFWKTVKNFSTYKLKAHDYLIFVFSILAYFITWHFLYIGFIVYCLFVFYEVYYKVMSEDGE